MITDYDYNWISNDVYKVDNKKTKTPYLINDIVANDKFVIIEEPVDDTTNGFQAMAVAPLVNGKPDMSEIVIAYAGTNSSDYLDIQTDLQMIGGGDTRVLADSKTKTFRASQGKSALAFAQKVAKEYPKATITTTGHSLGESLAMYVGLKEGYANVGYNGPDIGQMISKDELSYMKTHPEQFRNYRNSYDVIGNITGNMTGSAVYVDATEGIYNPLKSRDYHSLGNWRFTPEGNLVDIKGNTISSASVKAVAQTNLDLLRYNQLKASLKGGGYSTTEQLFLDSVQAEVIASGLTKVTQVGTDEVKTNHDRAVTEAQELWDSIDFHDFHALSYGEVIEAFKQAGVTEDTIVGSIDRHFKKAVTQMRKLADEFTTLEGEIKKGIKVQLATDQALAKEFQGWQK